MSSGSLAYYLHSTCLYPDPHIRIIIKQVEKHSGYFWRLYLYPHIYFCKQHLKIWSVNPGPLVQQSDSLPLDHRDN